ncbi:MAG: M24 family metallopeptidase [Nanoarchaeota archaeon]|nr:M24 family metallopeptidase [Nanoarchaeota archaeon]
MQKKSSNLRAQDLARKTMSYLFCRIREGMTEREIVVDAEDFMTRQGAEGFWYHNVGALVLVGERTVLSVSGRDYQPSDAKVSRIDLVTVDLSPKLHGSWGDLAKSFVIGDGKPLTLQESDSPQPIVKLFEGLFMEKRLHEELERFAKPSTTFRELHDHMNNYLSRAGYKNLDFRGNLGHTIETEIDKRRFIEEGCKLKLSKAGLFTFEPHIKREEGNYGFKMEEIYYFVGSKLKKL